MFAQNLHNPGHFGAGDREAHSTESGVVERHQGAIDLSHLNVPLGGVNGFHVSPLQRRNWPPGEHRLSGVAENADQGAQLIQIQLDCGRGLPRRGDLEGNRISVLCDLSS